jgi:hypothetical protein
MAKSSYATEMYNRIDNYMPSENEAPKPSGLLVRSEKSRFVTKDKQPINIVANAVAAIRKKREAVT